MIRWRTLDPAEIFVLFCAIVQVVFVSFAYGVPDSHLIYDPLLAAGVLVGIATMIPARLRAALLIVMRAGAPHLAGLARLRHDGRLLRGYRPGR
jgi:hypothetical protein